MAFNGSQVHVEGGANNVVHGDQINIVYSDEAKSRAFERLAQNAAPAACYDSEARFPPPNCHTGTRSQIIKKIIDWAENSSRTASIVWLYGTAGLGKSAVAQHIAEKYAASGMLGGAFFFSRNDSTRDKIDPFVASLAYQFCKAGSPLRDALRPGIIGAICEDPNIFLKVCERQLQELILKPCSGVKQAVRKDHPKLLIVDGLDECISTSEQERVLEMLRELLAAPSFPPWIILLCSRPEFQIRDAVKCLDFDGGLESFDMNSLEELNRDIETYFTKEFTRLRRKYQKALIHEMPLWPGSHVVDELVRRADKQMIFAVTVIKYIDTQYDLPQNRLTTILRIWVEGDSNSPYEPLDALYNQILSTCYQWHKVQPILRLLVTPHNLRSPESRWPYRDKGCSDFAWRSPAMLAQLLEFNESEVAVALDTLHSVLQIPRDNEANEDVSIAHATFTEFLVDPNRSTLYHTPRMSQAEYLQCLALFSLRILSDFVQHYPPHQSQSHAEALSLWQEKIYKLHPALELLLLVDIWPMVLQTVTSPSPDLLQALSKCDLYSLVGLTVVCKDPIKQCGAAALGELLVWAKSFGVESFPQAVEAFLSTGEFRLAFPPDAAANVVLEDCFETELLFWTVGGWLDWDLREISLFKCPKGPYSSEVLVLPPDCHSNHSMAVPAGWRAIHLARANAQLWRRVYRAVKMNNGLSQLCEDIKDANRSETVSQSWVWEDDLIQFRRLVKERLRFAQLFPAEYEDGVDAETSFSWLYGGPPTTGTNRRTLVARNRYRTVPYPPR
ncbi:hypothetical protein VNI00_019117 [Paramarasmius palmivorus]|uniref:NACHT domain-containing protein n=1 Tax=Paramarasmius palmivorus TaxID=297713 RepID=A0AAW0AQA4_9AGAR